MAPARATTRARPPLGEHLAPRRNPIQERAQKTVERILAAAADLIEETGLEGFNTNLLADRAQVRVRTVYRYFPNKLAVITAVAERLAGEWDRWFDGFRALSDPDSDWRALWVAYVDTFVEGIRSTPGGLAIRRAIRALPELEAVERRDNERLARQLAAALARRGVGLPRNRLTIASRVLIETAVGVLDLAFVEPPAHARALVGELKNFHLAYLAAFVEKPSRTSRR